MKITLKGLEEVLKNNIENLAQDDFLYYIPEKMFGTTVDVCVYRTHEFGIKTYMTEDYYMIPWDFVEEGVDD